MLSDKALKHLSDFILRKAPDGMYRVRTFCACSDYRRLDVKNVDDVLNVLNDFFEKFSGLIEDFEVDLLKPWLKPYGIEIEYKNGRYKAYLVKTGFEEKLEEIMDYYCCGLKKQALVLCRALMDEMAKDRGFQNFYELIESSELKDLLKRVYDLTFEDLSDESILFLIKVLRSVMESCLFQNQES